MAENRGCFLETFMKNQLREAFFGRAKTFPSIKRMTEQYTPLKKCYQAM